MPPNRGIYNVTELVVTLDRLPLGLDLQDKRVRNNWGLVPRSYSDA